VTAGIVLAAGGGTRFGGLKQLAELGGKPLVDHALDALRAVPAVERIVLVLGSGAEAVGSGASLSGVETVLAEDWEEGIAASLRAGIAAVADADAAVVVLADQPGVTAEAVEAVLERLAGSTPAARATYGGVPGHPVAFSHELFGEIGELTGDLGARDLLERHGVETVECSGLAHADDVDTPVDLDRLR
jgi:CTP:molybdopterin cytidylyltransferase MocA